MTLPNLAPYLDAVVAKGVYWLYHGADKAETQFEAKKKKKKLLHGTLTVMMTFGLLRK